MSRLVSQPMKELVQLAMRSGVLQIGNRVHVSSYGPFGGLKGTVLAADILADGLEEPCCFYLVALEGAEVPEPIWFEYHELEPVGFAVVPDQPQTEFKSMGPVEN